MVKSRNDLAAGRTRSLLATMLVAAAVSGCASHIPEFENSAYPGPEQLQAFAPDTIRSGDLLEIGFYKRTASEAGAYKIDAGDVLAVRVFNHPELDTNQVEVLSDGSISLPLLNQVNATGYTISGLAKAISAKYEAYQVRDPEVTIQILESDRRIDTVLSGIAPAGQGTGLRVRVPESGTINLPYVGQTNGLKPLSRLQDEIQEAFDVAFGNRVAVAVNFVERSSASAYVIGEVTEPGGIELDGPMNTLTAVAAAGGMLPTAEPNHVVVMRFQQDGLVDHWRIDLEKALREGGVIENTLFIMPGDVIYVPPSGVAVANRGISQYVRNMLPVSVGFGLSYDINGD